MFIARQMRRAASDRQRHIHIAFRRTIQNHAEHRRRVFRHRRRAGLNPVTQRIALRYLNRGARGDDRRRRTAAARRIQQTQHQRLGALVQVVVGDGHPHARLVSERCKRKRLRRRRVVGCLHRIGAAAPDHPFHRHRPARRLLLAAQRNGEHHLAAFGNLRPVATHRQQPRRRPVLRYRERRGGQRRDAQGARTGACGHAGDADQDRLGVFLAAVAAHIHRDVRRGRVRGNHRRAGNGACGEHIAGAGAAAEVRNAIGVGRAVAGGRGVRLQHD